MARSSSKSRRSPIDFDGLSWSGVIYVLVPGLVLGALGESAKGGITLGSIAWALFMGFAGLFVASIHLAAAEKVGARFLIPVIGAVSAAVGVAFFAYGLFIYLRP